MRTKNLNSWWDPYATSTPLKKTPGQLIKNKSQKQLVIQTDTHDVLKKLQNACSRSDILRDKSAGAKHSVSRRIKKNRLSAYFDPSSSSDEETEVQKRPIIKVTSKKSSRLLRNKVSEAEETKPPNDLKEKPNPAVDASEKPTEASAVENSKCKDSKVQNKKVKVQTKVDSHFENNCADSDEENKIFDKSTKTKVKSKPNSKNKANALAVLKDDLNSRHPSEFSESEKKTLRVLRANQLPSKPKCPAEDTCQDGRTGANKQKGSDSIEVTKFQKRKTKKAFDNSGPVRKRTRKANNKNVTPPLKTVVSNLKQSAGKDKPNLSHQLFSESTEQEYIDTLDLTSEEVNEAASLQPGNNVAFEPFMWPYPSSHKVCSVSKGKVERPKRKQQPPREFWMPKVQTSDINGKKETEGQETFRKVNGKIQEVNLLPNTEVKLKEVTTEKTCEVENNKEDQKKETEPIAAAENKTSADSIIKNDENLGKNALSFSGLISQVLPNQENVKGNVKHKGAKEAGNSSEQSVFKKSDELSHQWNGAGCSVVQCWNINKFKCGVFKLKKKSHFTCKTLHGNSYFGGVLIKGNLRMRIGTTEQDLKEGDMAFVPPLTEWQATNTGDFESVFYYWCGKFES